MNQSVSEYDFRIDDYLTPERHTSNEFGYGSVRSLTENLDDIWDKLLLNYQEKQF